MTVVDMESLPELGGSSSAVVPSTVLSKSESVTTFWFIVALGDRHRTAIVAA